MLSWTGKSLKLSKEHKDQTALQNVETGQERQIRHVVEARSLPACICLPRFPQSAWIWTRRQAAHAIVAKLLHAFARCVSVPVPLRECPAITRSMFEFGDKRRISTRTNLQDFGIAPSMS